MLELPVKVLETEELEEAEKKIETAKRSVEARKLYQKSFKAKAYRSSKK